MPKTGVTKGKVVDLDGPCEFVWADKDAELHIGQSRNLNFGRLWPLIILRILLLLQEGGRWKRRARGQGKRPIAIPEELSASGKGVKTSKKECHNVDVLPNESAVARSQPCQIL